MEYSSPPGAMMTHNKYHYCIDPVLAPAGGRSAGNPPATPISSAALGGMPVGGFLAPRGAPPPYGRMYPGPNVGVSSLQTSRLDSRIEFGQPRDTMC